MEHKKNLKWFVLNIEEIISTAALTAMLVICSCNVVARYCLKDALSWADEVCVLMLAWTTFVGSAAAYKRNMHFGMDFIVDRLPGGGKKILRLCINGILLAACGYLACLSIEFTMKAVKIMPFSRLSYKWIDSSAIVGFASMTIYSLIYLIQGFTSPEKYQARYEVPGLGEESPQYDRPGNGNGDLREEDMA